MRGDGPRFPRDILVCPEGNSWGLEGGGRGTGSNGRDRISECPFKLAGEAFRCRGGAVIGAPAAGWGL